MHANVLFPINSEAFTYIVPEDLLSDIEIGSRVEVPFKRSCRTGIVVEFDRNPASTNVKKAPGKLKKHITLKPIKSLLDKDPFLSLNIIRLINWVSQYYIS